MSFVSSDARLPSFINAYFGAKDPINAKSIIASMPPFLNCRNKFSLIKDERGESVQPRRGVNEFLHATGEISFLPSPLPCAPEMKYYISNSDLQLEGNNICGTFLQDCSTPATSFQILSIFKFFSFPSLVKHLNYIKMQPSCE